MEVIGHAEAMLGALRASGPPPAGLAVRVQDVATALVHVGNHAAELRDVLDRQARAAEEAAASAPLVSLAYAAGRDDERAELIAAGWRPPRARHAQQAPRGQLGLWRVQGAAVPAAAAFALRGAVRHAWAWAAHHAVLATAAVVTVPAVVVGAVTAGPAVVSAISSPPSSSAPAPAASAVDADPFPSAAPSGRQSAEVKKASEAPPPAVPVLAVPSPSSPAPAAAPPPGRLDITQAALVIGVSGTTGTLTLTADGGPVTWHADATAPLTLSSADGTIPAGESVSLTVSIPAGSIAGAGTVTVNGQVIPVTWVGLQPAPLPTSLLG